jgi:cellulose synthase/poly-beta-1,6-N-acetylglucosamine synthase-like glycosyltransferase
MSAAAEATFWTCLLLVAHTYVIYPALLFAGYGLAQVQRDLDYLARGSDRRRRRLADADLPSVSMVIPAHNEESVLANKLANLEALDYPADRLEVVFVSDGSTDRTDQILAQAAGGHLRVMRTAARGGKASALNLGVSAARHEVLVFSDAATLFAPDAVRALVRHFREERVGVVCGALGFEGTRESRQTEGFYWRYEKALRVMEARLGVTLTASGAIYALRRAAWQPLAADVVIDDFVVPMQARRRGYSVVFDPEATATEIAADSVADEFTRRVRLAVGSFRALGDLLRVPLDPLGRMAFFSHKLLRWLLPIPMMGLLASSVVLWERPLYGAALACQLLFYAWALAGFLFRRRMAFVRFGLVGYFLLAMNLAFLVGLLQFLAGRPQVKWKRATP